MIVMRSQLVSRQESGDNGEPAHVKPRRATPRASERACLWLAHMQPSEPVFGVAHAQSSESVFGLLTCSRAGLSWRCSCAAERACLWHCSRAAERACLWRCPRAAERAYLGVAHVQSEVPPNYDQENSRTSGRGARGGAAPQLQVDLD